MHVSPSHLRRIGKWCQRGAWLIATLGLLTCFLQGYSIYNFYSSTSLSPINPESAAQRRFLLGLFSLITTILPTIAVTIFAFLTLFAISAIITYIAAEKHTASDEESVEITSLPRS